MALNTDSRNASCLSGSQESQKFREYIQNCRTQSDKVVARNFLSQTIDKYVDLFKTYDAQFTNLLLSGDSVSAITSSSGVKSLNDQLDSATKQKDKLKAEIEEYRRQSSSADKTFLEEAYKGTPKKELVASLQDLALFIFWFSWISMSLVLIYVRAASPLGGWKSGLFAFVILLLVTLCMYALMIQVA